jgi:hypothetical protein
MATYLILSRISPQAFDDPKDFKDLAKNVSEKIKRQCPGVTWKDSFKGEHGKLSVYGAKD